MVDIQMLSFYSMSEPEGAQIQVLHATMMLRIARYLNGRVVIHNKRRRMCESHAKLLQNIAQPNELFPSLNSSDVLSFCARQSYNRFQFASLGDSCTSTSHQVTTCGLP